MDSIQLNEKGEPVGFSGEGAVDIFRIRVLMSSLKLLEKGIRPTRGVTLTYALKLATEYTGQKYKRTEAAKAREDLAKIEAQRLQHIPIIERT